MYDFAIDTIAEWSRIVKVTPMVLSKLYCTKYHEHSEAPSSGSPRSLREAANAKLMFIIWHAVAENPCLLTSSHQIFNGRFGFSRCLKFTQHPKRRGMILTTVYRGVTMRCKQLRSVVLRVRCCLLINDIQTLSFV